MIAWEAASYGYKTIADDIQTIESINLPNGHSDVDIPNNGMETQYAQRLLHCSYIGRNKVVCDEIVSSTRYH